MHDECGCLCDRACSIGLAHDDDPPLGCALLIGGIGGLIGLGGGEFRLPILVGLIGFTARAAVPMNQLLSLVTLVTALIVRWHTGSLVAVDAFATAVIALGVGILIAAALKAF